MSLDLIARDTCARDMCNFFFTIYLLAKYLMTGLGKIHWKRNAATITSTLSMFYKGHLIRATLETSLF